MNICCYDVDGEDVFYLTSQIGAADRLSDTKKLLKLIVDATSNPLLRLGADADGNLSINMALECTRYEDFDAACLSVMLGHHADVVEGKFFRVDRN